VESAARLERKSGKRIGKTSILRGRERRLKAVKDDKTTKSPISFRPLIRSESQVY